MKKQLFTAIAVVSVLLAVGSAFAQIGSDRMLVANVPFDFIVGKTTLPAGHYTIQSFGNSGKMLHIRGSWPEPGIYVLAIDTASTRVAPQSQLVFNRYGSRYFLSQIVVQGSNGGHQLMRSQRELEMARNDIAQKLVLVAQVQ